jgi:glycosyltransferase involved in cell wall biosynthesis
MRSADVRTRAAAALWGIVVLLTDLLPPRVRYGYVHRLTGVLLSRPLPVLPRPADAAPDGSIPVAGTTAARAPRASADGSTVCVLAADSLDVGGIGSVIEALALGLGSCGVRPVVVCPADGRRAERLRIAGVEVHDARDEASARAALSAVGADVVQLHSAPPFLERAAVAHGLPLVPVMHNTEIHFTRERWADFAELMARSGVAVAVSETVAAFHRRRVGDATPIIVVPNGAAAPPVTQAGDRSRARQALSHVLDADIGDDVVFLCLARYDAQKNAAGLVAAFGPAAAASPVPLRLVWAGDPSDRVELRRADALRRSGPAPDRIHLLGDSDARTLLAAADAFVLDSFFEGWPMAATEAAACGLPLLLADVGGARELVAGDPLHRVLVSNAAGDPALITDARVRSARRRSSHQANAAELQSAVIEMAAAVAAGRPTNATSAGDPGGMAAMLAGHAAVIRRAATTRLPAPAGARQGAGS